MDNSKLQFIREELVSMLRRIDPAAIPAWGKMSAQHMIEHLADFFDVSSQQMIFPLAVPEEYLPKYREFLYSDKHFRENTKAPAAVLGENPIPLRNASIEEALQRLQMSIDKFITHFENNHGLKSLHPAFGDLDFNEWILLHAKHVRHHLKQFGMDMPGSI